MTCPSCASPMNPGSLDVKESMNTPQHRRARRCPHCHGFEVYPSRWQRWDWLRYVLFLRPYRCERCFTRFWRFVGRG